MLQMDRKYLHCCKWGKKVSKPGWLRSFKVQQFCAGTSTPTDANCSFTNTSQEKTIFWGKWGGSRDSTQHHIHLPSPQFVAEVEKLFLNYWEFVRMSRANTFRERIREHPIHTTPATVQKWYISISGIQNREARTARQNPIKMLILWTLYFPLKKPKTTQPNQSHRENLS